MVALSSFSEPTDRVRHQQPNTTVYVNDNNIGKGTLYIAESYLSWRSDSGSGFTLEYPHISLHAISRDLTAFADECIFMMLDTDFSGETENNSSEDGDSEDQVTTELRLVPDDRGMLDAMFNALNICQTLHPDPEDSFSDEDFFEDADEDANEDIYMEETDLQMANMRIRNTDEIIHKNFVGPDRIEICDMRNMRDNYLMSNDLRNNFQDTDGADLENFADDVFEDTVENKQRNTENMVGVQQDMTVGQQDIVVGGEQSVVVVVVGQEGIVVGERNDVGKLDVVGHQDIVVGGRSDVGKMDVVGHQDIVVGGRSDVGELNVVGQQDNVVGEQGDVGKMDVVGHQDIVVGGRSDVGELNVVGQQDNVVEEQGDMVEQLDVVEQLDDVEELDVVGQQGVVAAGQEGIVGEGNIAVWGSIAVGQRGIAVGQEDTFGCQDVENGFGNYSGNNLDGMGQDGKSSS